MAAERDSQAHPSRTRIVLKSESTGKRILEQSRIRILCVITFFILSFLAVSVQLVKVSLRAKPSIENFASIPVSDKADMSDEDKEARELANLTKAPDRLRGDITDRNGVLLATSLSTASLFANPKVMIDKEAAARKLAKNFPDLRYETLKTKFSKPGNFVWIKRNLTPGEQKRANNLGIPGLYFQPEERRVYPHGNLLAHALGYVGLDNHGQAGIEAYFDKRLRNPDKNQESLALSIDVKLQNILHEELEKGMNEFSAIGATGVIMDVKSGEILAMANLPDFDPHHPASASDDARFNRAALGVYEMGSTFKTFTAAMAIDSGVVTMKSGFDTTRPIHVANFTITDSHPENRFLTVPEIYAYSSNIGTVHEAMAVGTTRQKAFLDKLGLFKPVDVEMTEKATPRIPNPWREINTMTIAYGHGISVTPLHLIRGIASLVGGGQLVNLTLVKDGNIGKTSGTRVISADTSLQIRRLMRLVVQHGTGGKANVPGYRVGGKTGTAEKVKGKSYNANAKMTLFVSTFPVDEPRYAMLIMLDEPKPTKATYGFATGGWNCAPVAGKIIARMGPLYRMAPEYNVAADDADSFWPGKGEASGDDIVVPPTPIPVTIPQDAIHDAAFKAR